MRRLFPRTVAAQLIAVLVVVLLLGQAINLFLIIGERRVQARTIKFKNVIAETVSRAQTLPDISQLQLPYNLPRTGELPGAFFVSRRNRAASAPNTKPLPKYQSQYEALLLSAGIEPLSVTVTLRLKGPIGPGGTRPPPPRTRQGGPEDGNRRPPPPRRQDGFRPPPPRQGGFRPPHNPDPTGPRAPGMQEIFLSAELEPGIWYNAMVPHYSLEGITSRLLLATGILMAMTILAAWFFARRITRPLSDLAAAADHLGRGDTNFTLEERGPSDLRDAAAAFNQMQTRLTRTLDTQRAMLRAIGHDLRTPITALRIRAENIPAKAGRDKFIATLNDMTDMTEEILSWSKDVSGLEDIAAVNLDALLASLTDDYKDQGLDVSYAESGPLVMNIRRVSLKRALTNLIDNALKYGQRARVGMTNKDGLINIHIDDDGPGIPAARLEDVLKPFVRLETSRSKETGGIGLGLSITESIIQAAGGKLILANRKGGGLRATIRLPGSAQ